MAHTKLLSIFGLLLLLTLFPETARAQGVRMVPWKGMVEPAYAGFVLSELKKAQRAGEVFLLLLDTPGGLQKTMEEVVEAFLSSPTPVVVYVAPPGARAASAGTFIAMAAHVLALAPGTTIGAAHPVALGPGGPVGLPEEYQRKVVEYAQSQLQAVARTRGRDETFAREAVTESKALGAEEALSRRVADLIARDEEDLFRQLRGRKVRLGPDRETVLSPELPPLRREPGMIIRLLHALAHPEVAYLLLLLGIYALIFELSSPGVGVAGALGAVALILALYALHLLEANLAALALIALGAALALAEHFFPTHGLLLGSGAVAFLAGSLLLIQSPFLPRLGLYVLLPALALFAAGIWALRAGWRAHRRPVATGAEGMIGLEGVAVEDLRPSGLVRVRGEIWRAVADQPVRAGEKVRVRRVEGLALEVERAEEGEDPGPTR